MDAKPQSESALHIAKLIDSKTKQKGKTADYVGVRKKGINFGMTLPETNIAMENPPF